MTLQKAAEVKSQLRNNPLGYALGHFGGSLPIALVLGSAVLFYVDLQGLDVRAYGAVMVVYTLVDAVNNPIFGYLSDRTRSRWGRRKPWLMLAAPLLAGSLVLLFSPGLAEGWLPLIVWFAGFVLLVEIFDSMIKVNTQAILPELYPRERSRLSTNTLRQGFQFLAMLIALAVTPVLTTQIFGSETTLEGFQTTAILYAVVTVILVGVFVAGLREESLPQEAPAPKFLNSALELLSSRLFWQLGAVSALMTSGVALVLVGIQLYVKYVLLLPVAVSFFPSAALIVAGAASLPFWYQLSSGRGVPAVWRMSLVALAVSFLPFLWAFEIITASLAAALVGFCYAGVLATHDVMIARFIDDDHDRHGARREGLVLAAFEFFFRTQYLVSGVALVSLAWFFGYSSGAEMTGAPEAALAWRWYLGVYPALLVAIAAAVAIVMRLPQAKYPLFADEPESAEQGAEFGAELEGGSEEVRNEAGGSLSVPETGPVPVGKPAQSTESGSGTAGGERLETHRPEASEEAENQPSPAPQTRRELRRMLGEVAKKANREE